MFKRETNMKEYFLSKVQIKWIDDNHVQVTDSNNGRQFSIITRPKKNMFIAGYPVKPRLYIGGSLVEKKERELGHQQLVKWIKTYFGPTLNLILNRDVEFKFSSKAGCSCGCSPGFIIQDSSISFDIWMNALNELT